MIKRIKIDLNVHYANENLYSETNQTPNKILDFNNVFLPNIARNLIRTIFKKSFNLKGKSI